MKIEELLFGTRSRNAEEMGGYYAHWEAQLYCAVITMVLRNLDVYIQILDGKQVHHSIPMVLTSKFTHVSPPLLPGRKVIFTCMQNHIHKYKSCRFHLLLMPTC